MFHHFEGIPMPDIRSRFQGCLVAGAIGDALCAAVEFMSLSAIQTKYGPAGIQEFDVAYGKRGAITDDTQMTLFTAEGLLRGHIRGTARGILHWGSMLGGAYQRWLLTQGETPPDSESRPPTDGRLFSLQSLHHRRAPGTTCLQALRSTPRGTPANNQSKGCGGVMRVAPVGLYVWAQHGGNGIAQAFELGCEAAALTHGHPTGSLSAGVLAALVQQLTDGATLDTALDAAIALLVRRDDHAETLSALHGARALAKSAPDADIAALGQGWVAEEALAMSLFVALTGVDMESALRRAVNHSGDSDSTGAIAGNLLGAMWGFESIPHRWVADVELADEIRATADDLLDSRTWDFDGSAPTESRPEEAWRRYPGH
jgi:ADP-ribosylglycohydrolase